MFSPGAVLALAKAGAVIGPVVAAIVYWPLWRSGARIPAVVGASLFAAVYGLCVWAFLIEPATLVVRQVSVTSDQWRGEPLRIGVISDTHVGAPHTDVARVERVVARMNRLKPDLVVLLGDYAGGHEPAGVRAEPDRSQILRGVAAFRGLTPPLGVAGVFGNHDAWFDEAATEKALLAAGVRVVDNSATLIARPGGGFWIAGLADQESRRKRPSVDLALAAVPEGAPVLLLTHFPDPWPQVPDRVALTLAGHTHCGQVNFPVVGRLLHASEGARRWPCGLYDDRGRKLYVSGGVGVSILPVRFRSQPEIAIVTLKSGQPALARAKSAH